jgi:putative hydrolase of the HAD superfamily
MAADRTADRLEAVLFDLGGTLDAPGVAWKERLHRLYQVEGIVITAKHFDPIFYRIDDSLVRTIPPTLSLRDTVQRLVAAVSEAAGLRDPRLTDGIATRFYEDALTYARDNLPLLSQLAERYRLGVVSNFYGNLTTVCDELGFGPYLSVIMDSAEVGWLKPDARIFRQALDHLCLPPTSAAFVGDSFRRDMAGARFVGMPHVWLVGDVLASLAPCCPGDRVIRTLQALRTLLL